MLACPRCRREYPAGARYCAADGEPLLERGGDPIAGATFGPYRVIEKLGSGAIGAVYRAEDARSGACVALELLHGEAPRDQERRFQREAETLRQLRHPRIVALVDFGRTDDGLAYLVLELIEGPTLARVIEREGPLGEERSRSIAAEIARGSRPRTSRGSCTGT